MRALDLKLLRDLWAMKGQALAITLVIAGGTATYVLSASTLDSLKTTQARLYRDYRFADVFAALKRAPASLLARISAMPGVRTAEARIAVPANLDLAGYVDPITAEVLSLSEAGQPALNRLHVKAGRLPEYGREQEAVVSDGFAEAHQLKPGDTVQATIYGRRRRLTLVGVVLSPEFIYQLQPGSIIPDYKSYAILWMNQRPLEAAFNMRAAFNQLSLRLDRNARPEDVIDRLDEILRPYGGLGAHGRRDQVSHRYLSEEFRLLQQMATMFPAIFLAVAAFLLNVVISRLMTTQRGQIALLKAFGYSTPTIVGHYLKLASVIVLIGVAFGLVAGTRMGLGLSRLYMEYYRFPYLDYVLRPGTVLTAVLVSAAAAALGTVYAVVRAALEPPAVAMQPAPPASYHKALVERIRLARRLTQATRMIVRNLERRPVKALLSAMGIALSTGILVAGGFWGDAVDFMVAFQFEQAQRDDLTVTFVEPVSKRALYSLVSLPGIRLAEPFRAVPARLRFEHRSYRTSVQGLESGGDLRRLLDRRQQRVELPETGILVTDHLARLLRLQPGQPLTVEVLEGNRAVRQLPVAGLVSEYVGVAAYMRREALNRLLREGDAISGAYLAADMQQAPAIFTKLKEMPKIAGTTVRARLLRSFYETMARQMLTFAFFNTILAVTIAVGVIYNTGRIAFSERSRELASLRVLGYTRGEISYILLGELALVLLIAIPCGLWIGRGLAALFVSAVETDIFRIPLVIEPSTYAFSALVTLVSAALTGALIKRKLDRLDLVAVLKTKE